MPIPVPDKHGPPPLCAPTSSFFHHYKAAGSGGGQQPRGERKPAPSSSLVTGRHRHPGLGGLVCGAHAHTLLCRLVPTKEPFMMGRNLNLLDGMPSAALHRERILNCTRRRSHHQAPAGRGSHRLRLSSPFLPVGPILSPRFHSLAHSSTQYV